MTTAPEKDHDLMLAREVAAYLRCSIRTVARLRQAGKLVFLPGRPVLIPRADLARYVVEAKVREGSPAEAPAKTISDEDRKRVEAEALKAWQRYHERKQRLKTK